MGRKEIKKNIRKKSSKYEWKGQFCCQSMKKLENEMVKIKLTNFPPNYFDIDFFEIMKNRDFRESL
jgi:hypothetical protein